MLALNCVAGADDGDVDRGFPGEDAAAVAVVADELLLHVGRREVADPVRVRVVPADVGVHDVDRAVVAKPAAVPVGVAAGEVGEALERDRLTTGVVAQDALTLAGLLDAVEALAVDRDRVRRVGAAADRFAALADGVVAAVDTEVDVGGERDQRVVADRPLLAQLLAVGDRRGALHRRVAGERRRRERNRHDGQRDDREHAERASESGCVHVVLLAGDEKEPETAVATPRQRARCDATDMGFMVLQSLQVRPAPCRRVSN